MSMRDRTLVTTVIPPLRVRTAEGVELSFVRPFIIGRGDECEVRIHDSLVSRQHVRVAFENGSWSFHDLRSGNGVYLDGRKILTALIDGRATIALGQHGPQLTLEVQAANTTRPRGGPTSSAPVRETVLVNQYLERYFRREAGTEPVGQRTMMIRKAFQRVQRRQRWLYGSMLAALAVIAITAAGYAIYGHRQMARQKEMALELFYSMKALDLDIANLERVVAASGDSRGGDQLKQYRERRRQLERDYDQFKDGIDFYNRPLTEQERLVLRVTRLFGECELAAPPEYLNEVMNYIRKWQSSERFVRAVTLADERGYTKPIADEFLAQNLPPQFFYLALQESNFDVFTSGPPTRFGIAKGMWQFIPPTAERYGLSVGPLAEVAKPDAADDRHRWDRATKAAARYIKDIYATDAQASGLLVMASYNWGEQRVIRLVQSLPANPKERNFWRLLERYRNQIPKETYDYVFYIVSAAVIGENPKLFGFPLDPPFAFLDEHVATGSSSR